MFTEFNIVRAPLCAISLDATFAGFLIAGLAFALLAFPFAGKHLHFLHRLRGSTRFRIRSPRPRTHFFQWLERRLQNVPGVIPVVVCCLMIGFGFGGLVASRLLHFPAAPSVIFGAAAAIVLITGASSALAHLFSGQARQMEGSTLVGSIGRISLCIPENGIGSVAYVAHGKRHVIPARSSSGQELAKGSRVLVTDLRNRVAIVEEL